MLDDERAIIGVTPAAERCRHSRLFGAFEQAYPVRFEGRDEGAVGGLAALVRFSGAAASDDPRLEHIPCLEYQGEERDSQTVRRVRLAAHASLSRPLWDSQLTERYATHVPPTALREGEIALATIAGNPVWRLRRTPAGDRHTVSIGPAELDAADALRSRLAPGRCLAVLALTQFIRNLTADRDWDTPGPRAAFVIDDPNLRRPTYGHINYPEMAASAAKFDYHVSIAMVPLDGRAFHAQAVQLFREQSRHLSLCIHGNNHIRDELRRPRSLAEGRVPAAQALRRSLAFERRTGVTVDRIMVAPHERLGQAATEALAAYGFEGFASTRPYPWLEYAHDLSWLSRPADAGPLVGWRSAELVGAGLLALLRVDFGHPREELVIRSFLGQPLIMYGHDDLLRGGPGALEQAVQEIGRLGDARWQSLAGIARSSYVTRRRGSTLEVRMLGRRVEFEVPEGVTDVVVSSPRVKLSAASRIAVTGASVLECDDEAEVNTRLAVSGPGKVEVALGHPLDPLAVPVPKASVMSIARRLAAEGRDRTRSKLTWAFR
ncbi:MAG: hypothetical protein ACTHMY_19725 [Solirubrobacteraceae bacterium]